MLREWSEVRGSSSNEVLTVRSRWLGWAARPSSTLTGHSHVWGMWRSTKHPGERAAILLPRIPSGVQWLSFCCDSQPRSGLTSIYSSSSPVVQLPLLGKHSPTFTKRSWTKVVSLIWTHVPRRLVLKGSQKGAGRAPPWSSTRLVSTASRGQRSLPQGFQGIGASRGPFWATLPGKRTSFPDFSTVFARPGNVLSLT